MGKQGETKISLTPRGRRQRFVPRRRLSFAARTARSGAGIFGRGCRDHRSRAPDWTALSPLVGPAGLQKLPGGMYGDGPRHGARGGAAAGAGHKWRRMHAELRPDIDAAAILANTMTLWVPGGLDPQCFKTKCS